MHIPTCTHTNTHRQQRLYAAQDIAQLVHQMGLPDAPTKTKLDLAVFDNTDYETRLPVGWVPRVPGVAPTPARIAVPQPNGSSVWKEGRVVDFDVVRHSASASLERYIEVVRCMHLFACMRLCACMEYG